MAKTARFIFDRHAELPPQLGIHEFKVTLFWLERKHLPVWTKKCSSHRLLLLRKGNIGLTFREVARAARTDRLRVQAED
jgi:hypothetical protein